MQVKTISYKHANVDVSVIPSMYEPFSSAIPEAMASGLLMVTTVYKVPSELNKKCLRMLKKSLL
ncbi:MAG: glycosyltransferase [Thermodesulfovibrionia bacterium]|nr:glycosyltransferase [Thermodesulfovibrionia bacterium]